MQNNINKTAYNFLCIMNFIIENRVFSVSDINNYLEKNNDIFFYKETILKYIRTLKVLGFKFIRLNNKQYKLIKVPFEIKCSDEDDIFKKMISIANNNLLNIKADDKKDLFTKLILFYSKNFDFSILNSFQDISGIIKNLHNYCDDALRLKILFLYNNEKTKHLFEPYEVIIENNEVYLRAYDITIKSAMLLNINKIISIKQTPQKNKFSYSKNPVTLKMTSKFAKAYNLKNEEKIVSQNDNELLVESFYYDKTLFFNNILRYMENCEILSPEFLRKEFFEYVKSLKRFYYCQN